MSISLTREDFEKACADFLSHWSNGVADGDRSISNHYARGWTREAHPMNDRLGYLVGEPFDRVFFRPRPSTQANDPDLRTETEVRAMEPLSFSSTEAFSINGEDELLENMTIPDEADDTAVELSSTLTRAHRTADPKEDGITARFRCWVVYSDSYRVPQLLFDGFTSDGIPLALEEIMETDLFIRQTSSLRDIRTSSDYPFNTLKSSSDRGEESLNSTAILPFITQIEHPYTHIPVWSIHPCNTPTILGEMLRSGNGTTDRGTKLIIEAFLTLISSLMDLRK